MMTSYAQNFEDVILWRALGDIDKGLYIDIGAQDPIIDSISLAFYEQGWRGYHIEPVPFFAESLRNERKDEIVIQAAIGETKKMIPFFEVSGTGISTALPSIALKHRERGFEVREIMTPCITLSDVFDIIGKKDIHWMKIDVEGSEKDVLSSWKDSFSRPWIVVIECTLPFENIDRHEEWEHIITSYGYEFVYYDGLNRFYLSNEHKKLREKINLPPNIFDNFSLFGNGNSPFSVKIIEKNKAEKEKLEAEFKLIIEKMENENKILLHEIEDYKNEKKEFMTIRNGIERSMAAIDSFEQILSSSKQVLQNEISKIRKDIEEIGQGQKRMYIFLLDNQKRLFALRQKYINVFYSRKVYMMEIRRLKNILSIQTEKKASCQKEHEKETVLYQEKIENLLRDLKTEIRSKEILREKYEEDREIVISGKVRSETEVSILQKSVEELQHNHQLYVDSSREIHIKKEQEINQSKIEIGKMEEKNLSIQNELKKTQENFQKLENTLQRIQKSFLWGLFSKINRLEKK